MAQPGGVLTGATKVSIRGNTPNIKGMIRPGTNVYSVFGKKQNAVMYFHGHQLALDINRVKILFEGGAKHHVGIPTVIGAGEFFRHAVRQEQKPPTYVLTPKGQRSQKYGHSPKAKYGHYKVVPNSGYSWYSRTLRRSWTTRLHSAGKLVFWGVMAPDPRKGQPPKWAKPSESTGNVNAFYYARFIEFGAPGFRKVRKERPVVRTGFAKREKYVKTWMIGQFWNYVNKMAKIGHRVRTRAPTRVPGGSWGTLNP